MDPRLVDHFERELRHVREMRREFAGSFPKAAGRLSIDGLACDDPYIERLTESYAFLAARVQLELEQSFPAFAQSMLEALCPACLSPVPSAAVVQLVGDNDAVTGGYHMPRGRLLKSKAPRGQVACQWRIAHDVAVWPLKIADASYHTARELSQLRLPPSLRLLGAGGEAVLPKAAVRLVIEADGVSLRDLSTAGLTSLPLFLPGPDDAAGARRLWEQIVANGGPLVVREPDHTKAEPHVVRRGVRRYGFEPDQAMIPPGPRLAEAHRLVLEYLMLPERFRFIELCGIGKSIATLSEEATRVEIVLPLRNEDAALEGVVSRENFLPFCTPVVNLFKRETDRKEIGTRVGEHHLTVDRSSPIEYEVWRVDAVDGFAAASAQRRRFEPLYRPLDPLHVESDDSRLSSPSRGFTWRRVARPASDIEQREHAIRSRYAGTDVYVTLAADREGEESLRQIGATVWCTNRDLPLGVSFGQGTDDLQPTQGEPLTGVRSVSGSPTAPRLGPAWAVVSRGGSHESTAELPAVWQLVNILGQNHVPLAGDDDGGAANAVRSLLTVLGGGDGVGRGAAAAIDSITATPVIRRVRVADALTFARGLQVDLTLDDAAAPPGGPLLLASVLEAIFKRGASINSFVELNVSTVQRGLLFHGKPRVGQRNIL